MKIAIQNTKGGVGKTRSAFFLAEAATRRGDRTTVWDIDPQGTATSWADRAAASGGSLDFTVEPINLATLRRENTHEGTVILDTPPGNPQITAAAFAWADITVIPTGPTTDEIERALETWNMGHTGLAGILLIKYAKAERESWDTYMQMRSADVPAFTTIIPRRAAIASAFGDRLPDDLYGYDRLLQELTSIMSHNSTEGEQS